jgi:hypothetical protein
MPSDSSPVQRSGDTLPNFSSFTTTRADGSLCYGISLLFYEPQLLTDGLWSPTMVTPKSICIISRWPFFDKWKTYLAELYHITLQQAHPIPIERYIRNLVHEVPLPPRGCTRVQMQIGDVELLFERPPLNELPTIVSSSAMELLFGLFSPVTISSIFACVLQEKSIVLHCKEVSFLTQVAHALTSLIFPLRWQHIYVPFLPTAIDLSDFISAPSPFIVGVQSDRFEQTYIEESEELVVVDFNKGDVWAPGYGMGSASRQTKGAQSVGSVGCPEPPVEEAKRLLAKLSKYARGFHSPGRCFEQLQQQRRQLGQSQSRALAIAQRVEKKALPQGKIKKAFFRFLTSLLRDYRDHTVMDTMSPEQLVQMQEDPNGRIVPGGHFETEKFVETTPAAARQFVRRLATGQAFQVFIDERIFQSYGKEFEILFFDHSVAAQKQKDGSQAAFCMDGISDFLSDQRYRSIKTFVAPSAMADSPRAGEHKTFDDSEASPDARRQVPDRLQSTLARTVFPGLKQSAFGKPVPKPVLDEESEIRRLSVTTNELIAQQAAAHAEAAAAHEEKGHHWVERVFDAITTPARSTHGRTLNRQSSSPLEDEETGGVVGSIGGCRTGDGGSASTSRSCKKQKATTTPSIGSAKRRRSSIGRRKRPPVSGSKLASSQKYATYPPSASRSASRSSSRRSGVGLVASIGSKTRRLSGALHRQSALSPAVSITHSPEVLSLSRKGAKQAGTPATSANSSHTTPGAAALAVQAAQGFRDDYEMKVKELMARADTAATTVGVAGAGAGAARASATHAVHIGVRAAFGELLEVHSSLGMVEEAVKYFDEIRERHLPSPHSQWQVVSDLVRALACNVSALRALRLLETWRKMTPEGGRAMQKIHSAACAAKQADRLLASYGIQVVVEAVCVKDGCCNTAGRRSSSGQNQMLCWSDPNDSNDYTVRCDGCGVRIVPQLRVTSTRTSMHEGRKGENDTDLPFLGQHYSPAVVKKELENLLKNHNRGAGEQKVQIANLLAEKPTLYWNLCVMFLELDCELDFMMLDRFDPKREEPQSQPKKSRVSACKSEGSTARKRARMSVPADELGDGPKWQVTRLSEGDEGAEEVKEDELCKQLQYDSPPKLILEEDTESATASVTRKRAAPGDVLALAQGGGVKKALAFDAEPGTSAGEQAVSTGSQSASLEALEMEVRTLRAKAIADANEKRNLRWRLHQKMNRVQVFCRVRPLAAEKNEVNAMRVDTDAATVGIASNVASAAGTASSSRQYRQFEFDQVFPSDTTQAQLFDEVQPAVSAVAQGYRACIFAYGQTGSGKTYTMDGGGRSARHKEERGVTQRAVETIFEQIARETQDTKKASVPPPVFTVRISLLEIYNEELRDLLAFFGNGSGADAPKGHHQNGLSITGAGSGEITVSGLTEVLVSSVEEVLDVLRHGQSLRIVRSNNVNSVSSRSHLVFTLKLCSIRHKQTEGVGGCTAVDSHTTRGKLVLVDLAGSERASRTGAAARSMQMTEAKAINKSLSALGDVVGALAKGAQHVPYRNSKLTTLLQDCLDGTCKTIMLVQASPALQDTEESGCSLVFAERVKRVKAAAKRRVSITSGAAQKAAAAVEQKAAAEEEVTALRKRVAMLEAQNGRKAEEVAQTRAAQIAAVKSWAGEEARLQEQVKKLQRQAAATKIELDEARAQAGTGGTGGKQQHTTKHHQSQSQVPPQQHQSQQQHEYEQEHQARKKLELDVKRLKQQLRKERRRNQSSGKGQTPSKTCLASGTKSGTQRGTPIRGSIGHARGTSRDSIDSATNAPKRIVLAVSDSDDENSPADNSQMRRLAARNRLSSSSLNSFCSDIQDEEDRRASLASLAFEEGGEVNATETSDCEGRRKSRRENSLGNLDQNTIALYSEDNSSTARGNSKHAKKVSKDGLEEQTYSSPARNNTNRADENSPFDTSAGNAKKGNTKLNQRGSSALKQPRSKYNGVSSSGYGQQQGGTPGSARRKRASQLPAAPAARGAIVSRVDPSKKQGRQGFLSRFF